MDLGIRGRKAIVNGGSAGMWGGAACWPWRGRAVNAMSRPGAGSGWRKPAPLSPRKPGPASRRSAPTTAPTKAAARYSPPARNPTFWSVPVRHRPCRRGLYLDRRSQKSDALEFLLHLHDRFGCPPMCIARGRRLQDQAHVELRHIGGIGRRFLGVPPGEV